MTRDFSETLDRIGGDSLEVLRRGEGFYNESGRYVPSTTAETFVITGSVQPLKPNELLMLPEGQRADETRKLYTTYRLKILPVPDHLRFAGVEYEVQVNTDWENEGGFLRYFLKKVA